MSRIIEKILALIFSVLLANAATAQNVTINGRPLVTNPRQQINSAQTDRVFGGLNIAVHSVPPAGQPAFLAGNPVVVQQHNAAVLANRHYNSTLQALPQASQFNAGYDASLMATQGWIAAASAPNVPLRPLTPAEYNRLFGGLNQAVPLRASPPSP
jgi:hypothetical protein